MGKKTKKPWGGRFSGDLSTIAEEIGASVHFDRRLYRHDIRGSIAHAKMLNRAGILTDRELSDIVRGLTGIEKEITDGTFQFQQSLEDIHMNIEAALIDRIGDAGRKLHTARSRNDQVALDTRLYLREEAQGIGIRISGLISLLRARAEDHIDILLPGYTHLQVAQPVRLSHHLLAHAWRLTRDAGRIEAVKKASDQLPLGSGALAGVNYPNDREFLRCELDFSDIIPNSMDAVSDRDFILDFLYCAAVLGVHLSSLCEELILWSTSEFGFIGLSDSVTTGSSIMPQKKNPDVAELVRGKTGRLSGNLIALLTILKGLPLTYNRDLQEDKEPLFDSVDTVKLALASVHEMISSMTVNSEAMKESLYRNYSTATDLADYLVKKGTPFRESHEIIGSIVRHCESEGKDFFTLTVEDLQKWSPLFEDDAVALLDPAGSVERKESQGGTSREQVLRQIELLSEWLKER